MFDRTAHVYDLLYSFKDYDAEAAALVELIRERRPQARSLLDVACGTGRHLEVLRATFPDVGGVDVEPSLLDRARRRLPGVPLTLGDMRSFDLGRRFDAVTCLFSSVGYLADVEELTRAVERMTAHLEPGGVLIVDGWVKPEAWLPGVNLHALAGSADGVAAARVSRSWRVDTRAHLDMRYLIATPEGFEELQEHHVLRLFTDEEYRYAIRASGLEPEVVSSPMGEGRDRYVAIR